MNRWMQGALALFLAAAPMALTNAANSDPGTLFPDLMLWATNCHICEIDKPVMSAFHDKHKETDATVFGISIDGHDSLPAVQSYLERHDVNFPNSVGEFLTVGSSMLDIAEESLRGTPTYLLFNPEGEITGVHAGHLEAEHVENFIASKQ